MVFIAVWCIPLHAHAQSLLPEGIIAWQVGERVYRSQENAFDANFQLRPIGSNYTMSFDNEMLLSGKAGKDLQRLATVLQTVGDPAETKLDLGTLRQDVSADLSATILGIAYGAGKDLTLYLGVPWTKAEVKNKIQFTGRNNALDILDRLGNFAFDELRAGLEQASRLDVATIQSNIESEGYGPIDHWQHSGIGDLVIGAKTQVIVDLYTGGAFSLEYNPTLSLPTGHADDPDLINDVGLGKGYVSIGQKLVQRFQVMPALKVGLDQSYAYNLDARLQRRVPEGNETVVGADRKANVLLNPGDDLETGAFIEGGYGYWGGSIRFSDRRHFMDKYSGSISGNYDKLSLNSDTELISYEAGVSFTTVDAFQRKEFPVPFIANFLASFPVAGLNSPNFEYYELTFTSFLDAR
ncbi:MAG: hypothetical protein RIQ81_1890 [Pseudomonadota bacterium]